MGGDAVDVGCGCDVDGSWCLPITLTLGSATTGTLEVLYDSPFHAVSGFQFDVDGVSVTGGAGGDAEAAGFAISAGGSPALGVSFSGGTIPAVSGLLITLDISYSAAGDASLSNAVFVDGNFNNINNVVLGDGVSLPCDDADADATCDHADDCVGSYDCADVCNGDNLTDECGTCDADASNDCVQDCAGEWGGEAVVDS